MKKGLFFIILAGVMWGTVCLFVDVLAPYGFTSSQMIATRLGAAFFAMLTYCAIFKRSAFRIRPRRLVLFALCGLTLFGTGFFYYESMQLTSTSTAVMLMYTSPVPIMLLSVLFLGECFTAKKGLAIGLMLVGCAFVAGVIGNFKPNPLGVIMGLLSSASYTGYNIFCKLEAKKDIPPVTATLYTLLFATLCAAAFCKPQTLPALLSQKPLELIPLALLHGLVTCLFPYLLYSMSMKHLPVGVAASLSIIEPMSGALLGFLVLREPMTLETLAGIVLIMGAVLLLGRSEKTNEKS